MPKSLGKVAGILVLAVLLLGLAGQAFLHYRYGVDGWFLNEPLSDEEGPAERAVREAFLSDAGSVEERCRHLVDYFAAGALRHLAPDGARIHYPGLGGNGGRRAEGLIGFARTGALLAAWVASGRGPIALEDGELDPVALLRRGLLAGTDPTSHAYWGRIGDLDGKMVEAPDIARILWLTRAQIWDRLAPAERDRIAAWLIQATEAEPHPNNWLLVPVTVTVALRALGRTVAVDETRPYERFKAHYLGHGWFRDGPGEIDYYNAWGITYDLFWISLMDETFDRDFIRRAVRDSAALTGHLIGPRGYPVMGRSVCYRTALPVPLLAQALLEPTPEAAGLARRATEAIWRTFVERGALQDGALTQGFWRSEPMLLDNYSGPGSCHWGLRSLLLAFLNPPGSVFWTVPEVALPVERADFRLELAPLGWIVEGKQATGEIVIEIPENRGNTAALETYSWWRRLSEPLLQRPNRPHNRPAKYDRHRYSSARPFWLD